MNQEMAAFFDRLAPDWDSAPRNHEKLEMLASLMGLPENGVVADIGCGKGCLFEHLLKTHPAKILAVDVSGEMIRLAKERHVDDRIAYIHGDFLDIAPPMLDAAVFFNSYPHFLDKEDLVQKLSTILQKGGILIIAHDRSRAEINGTHEGDPVSRLSVPLDNAEAEARKFRKFFTADALIDNKEMYLIKMKRR